MESLQTFLQAFQDLDWLDLTWVDVLDILVVTFVTYWIILLIKGTRAVHMVAGLAIVFIAYVVSRLLPMHTLHWIINSFLSSIILIIVVLFQEERTDHGFCPRTGRLLHRRRNCRESLAVLERIVE